ncbi:hypothetical protein IW148_005084 [Coemansia sp. RSA 1199]|nr:hypothetical protein IW148_005084 [Coemansia sp. RSA 1199]
MALQMKAVLQDKPGGVDELYIGTTARPQPAANEVLVKIHYFALNRMDILQREGKYPLPPSAGPILGVEMSGVVVEQGSHARRFNVGDCVFGLMYGGAYAQYATIDEQSALPVNSLSMDMAASLLECWYTAYQAVHYIGALQPGEDILIHAAAGGVGTAAIQLARMANARRIFVTAGSSEKLEYCRKLGATHLINYHEQKFKDVVREETGGRGVDVVCDYLLASYFADNIDALAQDGRMSLQGTMGGAVVEQVNLAPMLFKRLRIEGSSLRSRSLEYQRTLRDKFQTHVLPMIENGTAQWHIFKVFDWEEIKDAHRLMEQAKFTGKIVVRRHWDGQSTMSVINLAGLLIYRISARKPIEYLLLNDSYENHRHWYPPKGRTSGTEDELKCAVRETMDVTGLRAHDMDADEAFRAELKYVDGVQPKQVVYFLARAVGRAAVRSDGAGVKHQWCSLEQALERVVFQSMQNILTSAEKYIEDMRDRLVGREEGDGWRAARSGGIEARMGRMSLGDTRGGRQESRRGEWQDNGRQDTRRGEWQETSRQDTRRGEWQDTGRQDGDAGRARAQDNPRYKTKLCEKYEQEGECPYHHKCVFAHGLGELRVRESQPPPPLRTDDSYNRSHGASGSRFNMNPLYKTRLCQRFGELGECPYGEKCQFAHGEVELRVSPEPVTPRTPREPQYAPRTPEQGAMWADQGSHRSDPNAHRSDLNTHRSDGSSMQTWRRSPFEERAGRNVWMSDDGANDGPQPAAALATPIAQKVPSSNRPQKTARSDKPWIKVVEVTGHDLKEMGSPLADTPRPANRAAELEARLSLELTTAIARGSAGQPLAQHALLKEITHIEFRNNLTKQQLLHVVIPALFASHPNSAADAIARNAELLTKIAGRTRDQPLLLNAWQRVLAEPVWQKRASEVLGALYSESLLDEDVFLQWFDARTRSDCAPEVAAMRPFAHWLATAEEE